MNPDIENRKSKIEYSRPSILFLDQSGELGGAELFLLDLAIPNRDRSTVVLFKDGPFRERLADHGVSTEIIPISTAFRKNSSPLAALPLIPRLANAVRRLVRLARKSDIIYANTPKAIVLGAIAALLARRPLVVHLHDLLTPTHFGTTNSRLLARFASRATCIIANSSATRDAFFTSGGHAQRIEVIPNGFNPELFQDRETASLGTLRAELGIGPGFTVGIFGRLAEWKGQHVVLAALRELPGVQCLIIGDALFTDADNAYAASLQATAAQPNLTERVHFTGFRDDIPALMQVVDVVIHASTDAEPFGRVIVEAMLSARPVIATAAGGVTEILTDRETGLLVPPGNAPALTTAIRQLQDAPDQRAAIAGRARVDAVNRYALSNVLGRIDTLLNDLAR